MVKVTKFLLLIISILFLVNSTTYSTLVLVTGIITEEDSGNPIGVNIEIRDKNGKKIKTQSNSLSGEFQQILNAGEHFTVILYNDNIIRREFKFSTIDTNSYAEQKENWSVFKPVVGSKIFKGNIFIHGSKDFLESAQDVLEEMQMLLRFNRNLIVTFKLSAEMNHADKKGKKINKTDENLLSERIKILNDYISKWTKERNRIKIDSKSDEHNDFVVQISEIKNYLD